MREGLKNSLKESGLYSDSCGTFMMSFKEKGRRIRLSCSSTVLLASGEMNFIVRSEEKGSRTRLNLEIK